MRYSITILIIFSLMAFNQSNRKEVSLNLIPKPQSSEVYEGFFTLTDKTVIVTDLSTPYLKSLAEYLNELVKKSTGYSLEIVDSKENRHESEIILGGLVFDLEFPNQESYQLIVEKNKIRIFAPASNGYFYAIQTLRQLFPPEFESDSVIKNAVWEVPCCKIYDYPKFKWRGLLLDCCRHFMDKEFVKRYIDLLAYHKMNVLHWHLTEDQGWRIEIKKYPKLTETGAWRTEEDGTRYGGYYTQEDIKEIVEYAEKRYVTIIPEIEMPGHSSAAIAAYPWLSCNEKSIDVEHKWGVFSDIYCAGNDSVFNFIDDVITEVTALFPAPYIHIGGDEAPKERWKNCSKCQSRIKSENLKDEAELQSYFIKRVEKILEAKGKKLIGWDEILEGGLAPSATVQSWRGIKGGIAAANSNHDVIMSPTSHCYFDYDVKNIDLQKVYSFNPIPAELELSQTTHILGGECNMWTERAPQDTIDGKIFPRILAMSEALWTYPQNRSFTEFENRVQEHYNRLKIIGVRYGLESVPVKTIEVFNQSKKQFTVTLNPGQKGITLKYSLEDNATNFHDYLNPIVIDNTCNLKVIAYLNGQALSRTTIRKYVIHKALGCSLTLNPEPSIYYAPKKVLNDGIFGSNEYADGCWTSFSYENLNAKIDLGKETSISEISINFLQNMPSWILMPEKVEFYISNEDVDYQLVETVFSKTDIKTENAMIENFSVSMVPQTTRYIKIIAYNRQLLPEWHSAAGEHSWIFADEIVVK